MSAFRFHAGGAANAALVSGQQTGVAIAQWVAGSSEPGRRPRGRVPSAATIRRALRLVDPDAVERVLRERRLVRCGQTDWLGFPGARQGIARLCRARRLTSGREHEAVTYALTSLAPEQVSMAEREALWRGHWTVESQSHHVRDATCYEDAGQAWREHTRQTLAALRNGALVLFRLAGRATMAAAFRHVGACVTRAFTLPGCQPTHALRL